MIIVFITNLGGSQIINFLCFLNIKLKEILVFEAQIEILLLFNRGQTWIIIYHCLWWVVLLFLHSHHSWVSQIPSYYRTYSVIQSYYDFSAREVLKFVVSMVVYIPAYFNYNIQRLELELILGNLCEQISLL